MTPTTVHNFDVVQCGDGRGAAMQNVKLSKRFTQEYLFASATLVRAQLRHQHALEWGVQYVRSCKVAVMRANCSLSLRLHTTCIDSALRGIHGPLMQFYAVRHGKLAGGGEITALTGI